MCLWTDINVNDGSLHFVCFKVLPLEFNVTSPVILPLLEAFLKLFICSTVMHLLHILLNLCLFNFLFYIYIYIYIYIFLRRHEQQGLDSTEGWGLCYFGLGYSPLDSQSCVSSNIVMTNQPFSFYHFLELFQWIFFPIGVYTVKSLSIIPVHVVFPQLPFISSSPEENC
jgi:hypothetical protein